jgi:hypothetical protein
VPLHDEKGEYQLDYVLAQDMVAWVEQGEICDRENEWLGTTDVLITQYRKMLKQQIDIVRDGGEPINVFRDPAQANISELDIPGHAEDDLVEKSIGKTVAYRQNYHKMSKGGWLYIDDDADRFCPDRDIIVDLMTQAERLSQSQAAPAE